MVTAADDPADSKLSARLFASGMSSALSRWNPGEPRTTVCACEPPRVVRVRMNHGIPRVQSYEFVSPPLPDAVETPGRSPLAQRPAGGARERRTRIRPPEDVLKMHDRLFYLLQPPLETWLTTEKFEFPHAPFPFQMDGIAFLYPRHSAVLADVMGLGKTMQAICSLRMLLRAGEVKSVLVICPKPLVSNWTRELSVWAPEIPFVAISGDQTRRKFQWHSQEIPVRIANYELLSRDREVIEQLSEPVDLVILDEAQRIKNLHSTTSQVARSIRRIRSWALTGTPVENSTEDLHSIFEFVRPGHLSLAMTPRRMGKAAADYILRRTKEEVLTDLPPIMYRDAHIELTEEQWNSYELAQAKGLVRLSDLGQALTIQHVFELVLRLKQICNFDPLTEASAKSDQLESDLEEIAASGQKAIVFSQWVKSLDILQRRLARFQPLAYHGNTPHQRRDAVLHEFRQNPRRHVILMSYGAGSVGLNLQFCEYVFLFDRWWNPAVEDQAVNRAHRIGAKGPVTVTRFLSLGTIEERIDAVLQQKRELFETVIGATGQHASRGLSRDEIFGLFKLSVAPHPTP